MSDYPTVQAKIKERHRELNKLPLYRRKSCVFCGRSYPKTLLNIEGAVHHGEKFRCLNLKTCQREVLKNAKTKNKKA